MLVMSIDLLVPCTFISYGSYLGTFAVACIWSSAICLPVVVPFDYVLLWVFDSHSWQVAEGPEAA